MPLHVPGTHQGDELRQRIGIEVREWSGGRLKPNRDTLHYEATIDDPGAYSEPWTVAWDTEWLAGAELAEYICQENNQFLLDLKDDLGNPFFEDIPTDKL